MFKVIRIGANLSKDQADAERAKLAAAGASFEEHVYVNDDDIRYLQKHETPVKDGDTLSIIPSVAGGARP